MLGHVERFSRRSLLALPLPDLTVLCLNLHSRTARTRQHGSRQVSPCAARYCTVRSRIQKRLTLSVRADWKDGNGNTSKVEWIDEVAQALPIAISLSSRYYAASILGPVRYEHKMHRVTVELQCCRSLDLALEPHRFHLSLFL